MKKIIKAAFFTTIPVLLGYLSIGIAFGLLFEKSGMSIFWAIAMSIFVYAGSMQFIAISLLGAGLGFVEIAMMTIFVNIRHAFYGLSFLEVFGSMGKKKLYMIFSLTDETYSLLCMSNTPEGIDSKRFIFMVSLLNHSYWIMGTIIGTLAGSLITFNTKGIDFAMTALFIVILLEQWREYKSHIPVFIGLLGAVVSLIVFGPSNMVLPGMLIIVGTLFVFRNRIEDGEDVEDIEEKGLIVDE